MKLKVQKQPHGTIRVELTTDPAKKPVAFDLDQTTVSTIILMLDQARRVDGFKIELEL